MRISDWSSDVCSSDLSVRGSTMAKAIGIGSEFGKKPGESPKKAPSARGAKLEPRYAEAQGAGGETHQIASDGTETLTTQQGAPVADDQNTLRQGARGPALLEDFNFRAKIFHFDHEIGRAACMERGCPYV